MKGKLCDCGYQFPDIAVGFKHDELLECTIVLTCPQCSIVWEQVCKSEWPS